MPRMEDLLAEGQGLIEVGGAIVAADLATQAELTAATSGLDKLWVPATAFVLQSGAPTLAGTTAINAGVWLLDAAADEIVTTSIAVPSNWTTANVDLWWTNIGAGSGNVRWRVTLVENVAGSASTTTAADAYTTLAAGATNVRLKQASIVSAAPVDTNDFYRVSVQRLGSDGADTLANDAAFIGLRLLKAS